MRAKWILLCDKLDELGTLLIEFAEELRGLGVVVFGEDANPS